MRPSSTNMNRAWSRWPARLRFPQTGIGATALFSVLVAVFWVKPLVQGKALFYDTLLRLFHPNFLFIQKSLLSGEFPLWNPHLYAGVPFLANLQSALFYPTTYLSLVLSFSTWMWVNTWLHGTLGCLFMWGWAREYGLSAKGALLAGAIFGLNGFFVMHYAYPSNIQTYAWAPAILWALHGPVGLKRCALAGVGVAFQVFGGHPQFVLYTMVAVLGQALLLSEHPWRGVRWAVIAYGVGAGLSAVQWVPFLEFFFKSPRTSAANAAWAGMYSLSPGEFLRMLATPLWNLGWSPKSGDSHIVGFYFGPILLGLGLLGGWRALNKRTGLPFVLAAIGVLLAFGRHWPFFESISQAVPFRWIRFPAQAMALFALAVPLWAGRGLDRIPLSGVKGAIVLVGLLDLWLFSWGAIQTMDRRVYDQVPFLARSLLMKNPQDRVYLQPKSRQTTTMVGVSDWEAWYRLKSTFLPNVSMAMGLHDADGNEEMRFGAYDAILERMQRSPRSPWINLFSVRHVLSLGELSSVPWKPVRRLPPWLYENPFALSRVYVVPDARWVPPGETVAYIEAHSDHDFRRSVLLEGEGPEILEGGSTGFVEASHFEPNRQRFSISSSGPGWLVVADAYDAGWKAFLDGRPVPLHRANGFQRAVRLTGGRQEAAFAYRPGSLVLGGGVSLLTVLGLGVLWWKKEST